MRNGSLRRGVVAAAVFAVSFAVSFLMLEAPSFALAQGATKTKQEESEKPDGPAPKALKFETRHRLATASGGLDYFAVGETTLLTDDRGDPEAEFFSTSYLVEAPKAGRESDAARAAAARPVTFAFNGGPGSSSIWLHMGLLGPRLVDVPSDGQNAGAPPFRFIDHPDPLLAVTDVVMVDPIGTGWSRAVAKGDPKNHWGIDEDAKSVARFIRRWLSDHGRWASPKYILGESYGGIRGPLLVRELQGGMNSVALNGLMLISPAFDMEVVDGQDNDACFATVLPTFAATAWYHDALPQKPQDFDRFLAEVIGFVETEYVPALFVGRGLEAARRDAIVDKLHRYTGLSPDYLRRANLKVSSERFRRELLRDRGLVVGRLDTRYTGTEPDAVGEVPSGDPLDAGISGAYVSTFLDYLRSELDVEVDREYVVMSGEAGKSWKRPNEEWSAFQGYVDVAPALARGMAENPELRVFVASGLYDVATTFFAAEHNVRRSTMDPARVELHRYPAGHMMYVHRPTLLALSKAIREWITRAGTRPSE